MTLTSQHKIDTVDGQSLSVTVYSAQESDAPVIQVLHGMAEHAGRYHDVAQRLQAAGFTVWLHNHRGHGERTPLGHLAKGDWARIVDDVARIQSTLLGGRKLILFGHSMGSFIARDVASRYPDNLTALVLSGSNAEHAGIFRVGRLVSALLATLGGADKPSALLTQLSFGSFNKAIQDAKTPSDWLSRDAAQVNAYIADPLCGFDCTAGFWREFFTGLIRVNSPSIFRDWPASLPVYLFSGSDDPVGHYGKGVRRLRDWLTAAGCRDIELRLYAGGRHEMLNEINAAEVEADLLAWLKKQA